MKLCNEPDIRVRIVADNIISSLGFTSSENFSHIEEGKTGITERVDKSISVLPFFASFVDNAELDKKFSALANPTGYTKAEKLAICSVSEALTHSDIDQPSPRTLFILSTTKGNVELLAEKNISLKGSDVAESNPAGNCAGTTENNDKLYLWHTAALVSSFFGITANPLVVSNACISGLLAIITGSRLLRSGAYDNVIVTGVDVVSEFIYSGFNSFKSLSTVPCRPFDASRDGLSLGEAAGTVIMTKDDNIKGSCSINVGPGFSSNDANHISGPSRTGEGLYIAISRTLSEFGREPDFISAHGTATIYNDEMEAVALSRAGLHNVPVNSMKGYWGHTLGAAGVIESVACIHSMLNNRLIKTAGFSVPGVTVPLNIVAENKAAAIDNCLKIASGFGGCNAAVIYSR